MDVHARSTHAAAIDSMTGELTRRRFGAGVTEAVAWLEGLTGPVRACYEAGPTGFGLYRAAVASGINMQVIAPDMPMSVTDIHSIEPDMQMSAPGMDMFAPEISKFVPNAIIRAANIWMRAPDMMIRAPGMHGCVIDTCMQDIENPRIKGAAGREISRGRSVRWRDISRPTRF